MNPTERMADFYDQQAREQERRNTPHILALCEAANLILRPGDLYRFEAVPGCDACTSLAEASEARP